MRSCSGKPVGIDRLDPGEVREIALVPGGGRGEGVVAELIVVSVVADGSGQDGIHLEGGLPGVVEKRVLGIKARSNRGGRLGKGER